MLIANFFFDVNHFVMELKLNLAASSCYIMTQFFTQNKLKLATKVCAVYWEPLFTLNNTGKAYNYFLKK